MFNMNEDILYNLFKTTTDKTVTGNGFSVLMMRRSQEHCGILSD